MRTKLKSCLEFFGVSSVESWSQKYQEDLVLFRTSSATKNNPAAVAAWIRQGEIQAERIECAPWNPDLFRDALMNIRQLTRQKDPAVFIPKLVEICAACGVATTIVKTPQGCSASGATKFINSKKALLLLSFRYLSDDQFWFTFFHESGHLLLHSIDELFVERERDVWDESIDVKEEEANEFAAEILIPSSQRYLLSKMPLNKKSIVRFAVDNGISPGIVIGQLQFSKRVKHQNLNSFKRRYSWDSYPLK